MTGICYCTREDVKNALDVASTARSDAQIDRLIDSASRTVEGLLHRVFYPTRATRTFDFPSMNDAPGYPWRIWLDANEVVRINTLNSSGVLLGPGDYFLSPADSGPPYNRIDLNLASNASFGNGSTFQNQISITATFGYNDVIATVSALDGSIDDVSTTVTTTASSVGVGDLISVDDERMQVVDKTFADTGAEFAGCQNANKGDAVLAVPDGSLFEPGEVLRLDLERVLIKDISGNNLAVERAWDGTKLDTHTSGTVYAARALSVVRGVLGSAASGHFDAAPVAVQVYPGPIRALTIAETIVALQSERGAYVNTIGADGTGAQRNYSGAGLGDIRAQAYQAYGRKARMRAV